MNEGSIVFHGYKKVGRITQNEKGLSGIGTSYQDSNSIHILKNGETLWDIARVYYGNRHYSKIIAIYNNVENARLIPIGSKIKVPPLMKIMNDPKMELIPFQKEVENIFKARSLFMRHEKSLFEPRKDEMVSSQIVLPENAEEDLKKAISLIEDSIKSLQELNFDTIQRQKRTIHQLNSLSANLENLSKGNHDGRYRYDLDMVHQRIVYAILYLCY